MIFGRCIIPCHCPHGLFSIPSPDTSNITTEAECELCAHPLLSHEDINFDPAQESMSRFHDRRDIRPSRSCSPPRRQSRDRYRDARPRRDVDSHAPGGCSSGWAEGRGRRHSSLPRRFPPRTLPRPSRPIGRRERSRERKQPGSVSRFPSRDRQHYKRTRRRSYPPSRTHHVGFGQKDPEKENGHSVLADRPRVTGIATEGLEDIVQNMVMLEIGQVTDN